MFQKNRLRRLRSQLVLTFLLSSLGIGVAVGLPVILVINRGLPENIPHNKVGYTPITMGETLPGQRRFPRLPVGQLSARGDWTFDIVDYNHLMN